MGYAFARTERGNKYRIINTKGEIVNKKKFNNAQEFNQYGIAIVKKKDFWSIVDTTGKVLTDFSFTRIDSFSSECAYAINENGLVILHKSGKIIDINDEYYDMHPFYSGVSMLKLEGKYGYIDTLGNIIVPFNLTKATNFENGFAFAKKTGSNPICINIMGKTMFEFKGWVQSPFRNDMAIIRSNKRSIYIDTNGIAVFDQGFKQALPFSNNLGRIKIDKKWALINKSGQILNTAKYTRIKRFNGNYGIAKRSGSYGLFTNEGKIVLDVMYDELDNYDDLYFFLSVNDRVGHYHLFEGWIWEPNK